MDRFLVVVIVVVAFIVGALVMLVEWASGEMR